MSRFRLAAGILVLSSLPILSMTETAKAQDVGIAAVVNDTLISRADVEQRLNLVVSTTGANADQATRDHLREEVIHQLIDETLEVQEAKRENVTPDPGEVDTEFASIEHQNNMPQGGLEAFLKQHGVDKQVLLDQLAARDVWSELVRGRFAPQMTVGDDEVTERIKDIQKHQNEAAMHVAEIFLPVSDPAQDGQVAQAANRIYSDIRAGASFREVARQFSQASSAAAGGDLGWVTAGTLPQDVEHVFNQMQPGMVGGPFRLTGGYYIVAMIDRRDGSGADDIHYSLMQAVFPAPANASQADLQGIAAQAKAATQDARSCSDLNAIGQKVSPDLSGPLGDIVLSQLPPAMRPIISSAKVAVPLDPIPVHGGIGILMVCGHSGGSQDIDRNTVEQEIMQQKFQNAAQRYLAELRRTAYIDLRN